jgi:hypothetical protein
MFQLLKKGVCCGCLPVHEELVEPSGFPHFSLLATVGSARLKEEEPVA